MDSKTPKASDINKIKTAEELKQQTIKWLRKLEKEIKRIESAGKLPKPQYNSLIENMLAYVKDARHFIDKKDWVRAFEAVIYAYGILETCQRVGIIKAKDQAV